MSAREELLAQARKHMWAAWQLSSEELASQAASTLLGLGMLVPEGGAQELERLRARLDEVHRIPQDTLTPAEVRLGQYGERTKTWSTATYDSGTEKALHEVACALRDTLEETRDQRNAARLDVLGMRARIAELEAQRERRRVRLVACEADLGEMRGLLSPNGFPRRIPPEVEIHERVAPAVDWLINRVTELEVAAVEGRAALAAFCHDHQDPGTAALGALYLLQQATPGTPMEPGETVPKVYRASHDAIVMGLYTTAAAARAHCEAEERRSWGESSAPTNFDWIEDEEDGVAEMTAFVGGEERTTGYVVTPLEVAAAYDPDGDE